MVYDFLEFAGEELFLEHLFLEPLYILIELGYIYSLRAVTAQFISCWRAQVDTREGKLVLDVLQIGQTRPLSLKQLAMINVRNCLPICSVLKSCYALPIPKCLQDYLSLKKLNAEIRSWIIEEGDHDNDDACSYNPKAEVLARYYDNSELD